MKKILDVPYGKQKLWASCVPSCVRMVLKYYGDSIEEKDLYRKSVLPGHRGTWDVKIGPELMRRGYKVSTYWQGKIEGFGGFLKDDPEGRRKLIAAYKREYAKALKSGMVHRRNADLGLIRKLIDTGIPVITEVSAKKFYKKNLRYAHMIVIVGYDKDSFYIHDPDPELGGRLKKVTAKRFFESWANMFHGFKRSMFVIRQTRQKLATSGVL